MNIRVPRKMWDAYGRVCARMDKDRTEGLIAHMRKMISQFGDEADRDDLAAAEAELAERRARKGGRPRKATAAGVTDGDRSDEAEPGSRDT
jgi:hypothetical protein